MCPLSSVVIFWLFFDKDLQAYAEINGCVVVSLFC